MDKYLINQHKGNYEGFVYEINGNTIKSEPNITPRTLTFDRYEDAKESLDKITDTEAKYTITLIKEWRGFNGTKKNVY